MLAELKRIVQEVNAMSDLRSSLDLLVQRVKDSMGVQVCSIFLWHAASERYVLMATEGLNKSGIGQVSLTREEGIIGLVGRREEPLNLADASLHPAFHYVRALGEESLKAFMAAPIIHQRQLLGVLVVQRAEATRFNENDEAFLVTMAAQLSGFIAHAQATGGLRQIGLNRHTDILNLRFDGVAGSPGIGIGHAWVVSSIDLQDVPLFACQDIDQELRELDAAVRLVRSDIARAGEAVKGQLSQQEQALFDVYLGMLDESALTGEVKGKIKEGYRADGALAEVIRGYSQHFAAMDDPYLRERATDIRDMGRRVLAYLQQDKKDPAALPDNAILVGDELTPAILGEFAGKQIAGIVSLKGSANSHIAIIARAMGIPTVMGVTDLPWKKVEGRELVVDGYRGHVYRDLSPGKRQYFQQIVREEAEAAKGLESIRDLPCMTLDGHRVSLMVNTGLLTDVVRSQDKGAEGVGLYRTEVPFMMRDRFPTESEQTDIYRQQLAGFAPLPVTMRSLDVGGDKSLPYFPITEDNPFLGWRGVRVTLDHPEIFLVQIRAMIRASEGLDNLRIMLPMLTQVSEVDQSMALIRRVVNELQEEGLTVKMPKIGIMVEVPAAVYQVKQYASRVDFLSVGSNDLTQYLLAVDRNNPRVADLYDTYHPSVLQALHHVVQQAHQAEVSVSICGEFAGDPAGAILLMAMGYDILSMSSTSLLRVKSMLRQVHLSWAENLLRQVLQLESPQMVRAAVAQGLQELGFADSYMSFAHGRLAPSA